MVNPWRKYRKTSKRNKQTLHSLSAGFTLFVVLYIFTRVVAVPLCPIQAIFGVSCPGCGMMRGFLSVLRLDFVTAWHEHVLSIPLFAGVVVYATLCISDILFDREDGLRIEKRLKKWYMWPFYVLILGIAMYINPLV